LRNPRKGASPLAEKQIKIATIAVKFNAAKANYTQECMVQKIVTQDRRPCTLKVIAGVDADYNETTAFGAAAVLDMILWKAWRQQPRLDCKISC
jgi:hypothetical protein